MADTPSIGQVSVEDKSSMAVGNTRNNFLSLQSTAIDKPRTPSVVRDDMFIAGLSNPCITRVDVVKQPRFASMEYEIPNIERSISPVGDLAHEPSTILMEDAVMTMEGSALFGNMVMQDLTPIFANSITAKPRQKHFNDKPRGIVNVSQ